MAAPSIDPLQEGDALTAASIYADRMATLVTALENIDVADLADGALTENHLQGLSFSTLFSNGYNAISPFTLGSLDPDYGSGGTRDNYRTAFDTNSNVDFQTFSSDTTSSRTAPYGPPAADDEGWAILAFNRNTSYAAEVTLSDTTDLNTSGDPNYLLCRGNVGVYSPGGDNGTGDVHVFCAAIGWADGSGNRFIDEKSIRFIESQYEGSTLPVLSVLTAAKIAAVTGDNDLESVFLAVCGIARGASVSAAETNLVDFYSLTVTPILAGSM